MTISPNLKNFANALRRRLRDDWDVVIAVAGKEGIGKSTLAIQLSQLIDKNFDLENNIAYLPDPQEIGDKFSSLKQYSVFMIDEAAKVLYKLRWMEKLQVKINEMYQTERWQNKATVLCIPRFTDLNDYFRNHRVAVWIQVPERGVGVAFVPDDTNIWTSDAWHLKENERRVKKYMMARQTRISEMKLDDKLRLFQRCKSFFFGFRFDPMEPETDEQYRSLRVKYRKIKETMNVDVDKERARAIRMREAGTSIKKIAEWLGHDQSTISRWVRNVPIGVGVCDTILNTEKVEKPRIPL